MNPYLILLPYVTVIPVNALFEFLIAVPTEYKDKHLPLPTVYKVKKYAGISLGVLASLGCIFVVYVLAANKTKEQNDAWMYDFAFVMFQDFFITPLLIMGVQFVLINLAISNKGPNGYSKAQLFLQKRMINKTSASIFNFNRPKRIGEKTIKVASASKISELENVKKARKVDFVKQVPEH